jgi:hypothetical protein
VVAEWATPTVDFWHDRAVFHFLVEQADRDQYFARLRLTPLGTTQSFLFALFRRTR